MTGEPVLDVRNLETHLMVKSGALPVVDGVSFSVNAGETLGIVGESGCGKSMTALSIMRVLPRPIGKIVGGEILLRGDNLVSKTEAEMTAIRGSRLGMILQDPHTSLNPLYSVGNQVIEALKINDGAGSGGSLLDRAVAMLRKVNVADAQRRVHAFPHQMSGGMKQRVVGAIAISGAPDVIIADEPTTALDVTIQLQYLKLLQEIQAETGMAMLFITHDLGIVANLCHRLIVMYAGRIVEEGSVRDVFKAPSHPYTEALLNSVPAMNKKVDRLYAIKGQPPALTKDRVGCSFAPRCPYADDTCRSLSPTPSAGLSGSPDHRASCWKLERSP